MASHAEREKLLGVVTEGGLFNVLFPPMPGDGNGPHVPRPPRPPEPAIERCTLRASEDDRGIECIDIECRFRDGQKFAAVTVDGEFPQLATDIANWLNERAAGNA